MRLTKGAYDSKTVYSESPLEVAKQFEAAGLKRLHLVDLDGAKSGAVVNLAVLEEICSKTELVVDFGGGVKTSAELKRVLDAGASQVTGGSIAVKNPEEFLSWIETYGSERIILGADCKDGMIAVSGWQEESELELFSFIKKFSEAGIRHSVVTDISKDGMLQGTNVELYTKLSSEFPEIGFVASGGVTSKDDLDALLDSGVSGAIVGKAIYENHISLEELSSYVN